MCAEHLHHYLSSVTFPPTGADGGISRQTTGSLSPRHPTKTDYFRCGNSLGSGAGAAISPPESRHSWLMRSLNERANYRNDSDIFREYSTENRLRGSKHKSSWQIILQQKHFASWSYLTCVQVESLQSISGSEFGIWNLPVSYKLPYISLSLWKIRTSLQLKLISLSHLIYKR